MEILRITRSELYELVWLKPLRDVADQLSMSDVGVAKLCDRNKVPRPPNGYWLRKHKRKQSQTLKGDDKPIIVYLPDKQRKMTKADIDIPEVPASARSHKEVTQCRSDLKAAKPDEYGRLVSQRNDMKVSRKTLPRALSIMNQIVRTAQKLGYRVNNPKTGVQLIRNGASIGICF